MSAGQGQLLNGTPVVTSRKARRVPKRPGRLLKSVATDICKVCGDQITRHVYGVLACRRCKEFFSRSISKAKQYKCSGAKESRCIIGFGPDVKNCPRCHLKKCEKHGMSRLGVKMRESAMRCLPLSAPDIVRKVDRAYNQLFSQYDRNISANQFKPLLLSDMPLDKPVASYKANMCSQLCAHYASLIANIVQFSRQVPGFTELPNDDQLILLKTAFIDIWLIVNASKLSLVQDTVTLSDGTQIPICEVTTVYTKEYVTSIMELSDEFRVLNLLRPDRAILIALALLCPERPNLIEKCKVEELRESYMSAMKDYIQITRPTNKEFGAKLHTLASNIYDIGKQHALLLNMYRGDVSKLAVVPVITELFDLHPPSAYKEG